MILEKQLQKYFNYQGFRTGQKEIITSVMESKDTIAMLPTGTGKSLCYQLPGYLLNGHVIVISPLLSLMQDQAEQLMMNGEKRVIAFNSFLTEEERNDALHHLHDYKFIFLSPEMLRFKHVISKIKQLEISLFVIDEAHCISQWGYDFRPDYLKLGEVRRILGNPVTLALTATATKDVRDDIISTLAFDNWNEYIYSVDRPNIALNVEIIESHQNKLDRLIELVKMLAGPGIIYFNSKKMCEQVAFLLKSHSIGKVMAYHGGMEQGDRILIQQQFIYGQLDIICATSAFGMGINKNNVRFVIHFHMPLQMESYLQEIGRAGRDGKKSIAILLYSPGDEQIAYQLSEGEIPDEVQIDWIFQWLKENQQAVKNLSRKENELKRIASLSDIQWRLISDFLQYEKNNDLDLIAVKFKQYMNGRLQIKQEKIREMHRFTFASGCRRKKILNYFEEDGKIEIENCCDQCGIEMSNFYPNIIRKEAASSMYNWKKHLAEILLNE